MGKKLIKLSQLNTNATANSDEIEAALIMARATRKAARINAKAVIKTALIAALITLIVAILYIGADLYKFHNVSSEPIPTEEAAIEITLNSKPIAISSGGSNNQLISDYALNWINSSKSFSYEHQLFIFNRNVDINNDGLVSNKEIIVSSVRNRFTSILWTFCILFVLIFFNLNREFNKQSKQ